MISVVAVVVTFNRKALLLECIAALLRQTFPLEKMIIIDNASTDGTYDSLLKEGYLDNDKINYQFLCSNTGGAGGFHEGIKLAHSMSAEWIWVMDDDAEPVDDCLYEMQPFLSEKSLLAVCPVVSDSNLNPTYGNDRGVFIPYSGSGNLILEPTSESYLKGTELIEIDHASFVGLCFRKALVDIIGLPKKEFFIHYDDSEYCSRISKFGPIILVPTAIIKHNCEAKKGSYKTKKRFYFKLDRVKIEKLWLSYYGYRNLTWLAWHKKIKVSKFVRFIMILRLFRLLFIVLIIDDNKMKRINFWVNAFMDGVFDNFDNAKPKKILS
jgi:GT2 family glycosyltransferase